VSNPLVIHVSSDAPENLDVLGVPVQSTDDGPRVMAGLAHDLAPSALDPQWCARQGFTARPGQVSVVRDVTGGTTIVLVGLGAEPQLAPERWRRAAASLVRAGGEGGRGALLVPDSRNDTGSIFGAREAQAVAEGAQLATYRYDTYKSTKSPGHIETLVVVSGPEANVPSLEEGVHRGVRTAEAVAFARNLINTPPSDLNPHDLAAQVVGELAHSPGVDVEVWEVDRITDERLGGLLGVSRGSSQAPVFVKAHYVPPGTSSDSPPPHVVLVGKGITFDSGGLSLKTADGMTTMKTDMSGAAVVLATISACADLGVGLEVTALAPVTENMPGGSAIKPGDVLTIRNGATIEVLNTDAEGRLVLADALSLAAEMQPAAIIDIATLTGAVSVALGTSIAGLFSNDMALQTSLLLASAESGEQLWALPMPDEYNEHIDSDVADMKNIGRAGQAGSIAAALLLKRFVGTVPWAHLDIAGTGRSAETQGYFTKGGTAFGVRTFLAYLADYPVD
jgi:leucyl aminopeptidase